MDNKNKLLWAKLKQRVGGYNTRKEAMVKIDYQALRQKETFTLGDYFAVAKNKRKISILG
jgi:hypothetical protein